VVGCTDCTHFHPILQIWMPIEKSVHQPQLIDFTQMFKSRSDTILKIQLRLKAHQTTALQVFLQFEVFKTAF
jgi:hypothetical protein